MRILANLFYVCTLVLLSSGHAQSEFLRSLEEPPTVEVPPSNTTSVASPGNNGRLFAQTRCARADVCFNNPGFLNGFRMHKITRIRNGYSCKSVCVPTGACLFTTCTGNFFFWTLGLKNLLGWECGTCPS